MKCVVPGPNVKILARAIHSLAKLGDELYVESTAGELSFRTVNMSKTAYACFSFDKAFFSYFSEDGGQNQGAIKCNISMKSSLAVFKSPVTLDKTLESCEIGLEANINKLVFQIKYKRGAIKTYHIPIIECETLQAFYLKNKTPNHLTVDAKVISNILHNFQNNQEEITLHALNNKVIVRNYSDSDDISGIRTELNINSDEFTEFKINKEGEVTFCLKELRAVLLFSESVNLPISCYFSVASKPIVFVVKSDSLFEANIVVSTLTGENLTQSQDNTQVLLQHNVKNRREVNKELKNEFKRIFQRCFQTNKFNIEQIPGYKDVLVPDSDESGTEES